MCRFLILTFLVLATTQRGMASIDPVCETRTSTKQKISCVFGPHSFISHSRSGIKSFEAVIARKELADPSELTGPDDSVEVLDGAEIKSLTVIKDPRYPTVCESRVELANDYSHYSSKNKLFVGEHHMAFAFEDLPVLAKGNNEMRTVVFRYLPPQGEFTSHVQVSVETGCSATFDTYFGIEDCIITDIP